MAPSPSGLARALTKEATDRNIEKLITSNESEIKAALKESKLYRLNVGHGRVLVIGTPEMETSENGRR